MRRQLGLVSVRNGWAVVRYAECQLAVRAREDYAIHDRDSHHVQAPAIGPEADVAIVAHLTL